MQIRSARCRLFSLGGLAQHLGDQVGLVCYAFADYTSFSDFDLSNPGESDPRRSRQNQIPRLCAGPSIGPCNSQATSRRPTAPTRICR
jgi:hypothetical protein